jgi:hypothetical protein
VKGATMNGKEVANELLMMTCKENNSADIDLFANEIVGAHRTNQQTTMKLLLRTIVAYADNYRDGNFDLRNQRSCELANKILIILEDEDVVFRNQTKVWVSLPLI